jgi:VanZ family protein
MDGSEPPAPDRPLPRRLALWMSRPGAGFAVSAALALVVTLLTLSPVASLPPAPGGDKLHHFMGFAAIALPASFARPRAILWIVAAVTLHGIAIEIIQPFVGRYGEALDAVANTAGAAFGGIAGAVLRGVLVPDQD